MPEIHKNVTRAVFLDRDNTLIHDPGYLCDPEKVRVLDGVVEGLKELQHAGYKLVAITNQSGVGRGYFDIESVRAVNERVKLEFEKKGVRLDGFYVCPHHPDEKCNCRKPMPGLLHQAAEDLQIDLSKSFMVGDKRTDVECGQRAKVMMAFLVLSGPQSARDASGIAGQQIAENVNQVAQWILEHDSE